MADFWSNVQSGVTTAVDDVHYYANDMIGRPQDNPQNGALQQGWNFVTSGYRYIDLLGSDKGAKDAVANNGMALAGIQKPADPATPGAQPTASDATNIAIAKQLAQERRNYSASSLLTGGQGLLDSPTTSSRTLLGS